MQKSGSVETRNERRGGFERYDSLVARIPDRSDRCSLTKRRRDERTLGELT